MFDVLSLLSPLLLFVPGALVSKNTDLGYGRIKSNDNAFYRRKSKPSFLKLIFRILPHQSVLS